MITPEDPFLAPFTRETFAPSVYPRDFLQKFTLTLTQDRDKGSEVSESQRSVFFEQVSNEFLLPAIAKLWFDWIHTHSLNIPMEADGSF